MRSPRELNYYMPAEWHPHKCCWMQWPYENPNHAGYKAIPSWSHFDFEKGRMAWANVAKSISEFEQVKMLVHPNNITNAITSANNAIASTKANPSIVIGNTALCAAGLRPTA